MKHYLVKILNKLRLNKIESKRNVRRIQKLKQSGKSDFSRWSKNDVFHDNWNERTKMLATYLNKNAKIIEFGAGSMSLRSQLLKSQRYTPSDLVSRTKETIVYDLNGTQNFDFKNFDTAFFSGVLEYVFDIEALFKNMMDDKLENIILSYKCFEGNKRARELNGWLSDYTERQLEEIFNNFNYRIVETNRWNGQKLYSLKLKQS